MAKYTLTSKILETFVTNNSRVATELGLASYNDYQGFLEMMDSQVGGLAIIDLMFTAINQLENLDPLFSPITTSGTDATKTEIWSQAKFKGGAMDTMGKSSKPVFQSFTIPFEDKDSAVSVDKKLMMLDEGLIVDRIIRDVYNAYVKLLRVESIKAIMIEPTEQSRNIPCFWRNTSTFTNAKDKLIPHPNGLRKFTNSESHYLGEATYSKELVNILKKKVRSKGYGEQALLIVANDETWKKFKDKFTYDDVRGLQAIEASNLAGKDLSGGVTFVTLPDSVFPDDYILAFDPTVQFLYKKEHDRPEMRGLQRMFETFSEVRINHRAEFKVFDLGFGVIEKGAGAVMHVGNATYQNPTLDY